MSVIPVCRYAGGYEDRGILFGRPKVGMVNSKKKRLTSFRDGALVDFARYGNYITFHSLPVTRSQCQITSIHSETAQLDNLI